MPEYIRPYTHLPLSAAEIPAGGSVRAMPYVRFIAESLCEDPSDKEELQKAFWQIDAMLGDEVITAYDRYRNELQSQLS